MDPHYQTLDLSFPSFDSCGCGQQFCVCLPASSQHLPHLPTVNSSQLYSQAQAEPDVYGPLAGCIPAHSAGIQQEALSAQDGFGQHIRLDGFFQPGHLGSGPTGLAQMTGVGVESLLSSRNHYEWGFDESLMHGSVQADGQGWIHGNRTQGTVDGFVHDGIIYGHQANNALSGHHPSEQLPTRGQSLSAPTSISRVNSGYQRSQANTFEVPSLPSPSTAPFYSGTGSQEDPIDLTSTPPLSNTAFPTTAPGLPCRRRLAGMPDGAAHSRTHLSRAGNRTRGGVGYANMRRMGACDDCRKKKVQCSPEHRAARRPYADHIQRRHVKE